MPIPSGYRKNGGVMKKTEVKNMEAFDLFCGVGGLSYGLKQAGIRIIGGLDSDVSCRYPYEANNGKFIGCDIENVDTSTILNLYSKDAIQILVGCAPCQTFSKHTQKMRGNQNDKKWFLLNEFSQKIRGIKPDIVSMENVPELIKYAVYDSFIQNLKGMGYYVNPAIVKCEEYGIPQYRKRLVVLASALGHIELIPATHPNKEDHISVMKTIGSQNGTRLPHLEAGEIDADDPLHRCYNLSEMNKKRIRQSKPGGSWRDWDKCLLPECYKRASGKTYSGVYGRLEWNKPASTITTQFYAYGTGRFGHPEQDRALSLREGALLQTFPPKYEFYESKDTISFPKLGRHIGNAVPVRLGVIIGRSIVEHLEELNEQ